MIAAIRFLKLYQVGVLLCFVARNSFIEAESVTYVANVQLLMHEVQIVTALLLRI